MFLLFRDCKQISKLEGIDKECVKKFLVNKDICLRQLYYGHGEHLKTNSPPTTMDNASR